MIISYVGLCLLVFTCLVIGACVGLVVMAMCKVSACYRDEESCKEAQSVKVQNRS